MNKAMLNYVKAGVCSLYIHYILSVYAHTCIIICACLFAFLFLKTQKECKIKHKMVNL